MRRQNTSLVFHKFELFGKSKLEKTVRSTKHEKCFGTLRTSRGCFLQILFVAVDRAQITRRHEVRHQSSTVRVFPVHVYFLLRSLTEILAPSIKQAVLT